MKIQVSVCYCENLSDSMPNNELWFADAHGFQIDYDII